MLTVRALLLALVLLAGGCAAEHATERKIAEAATAVAATASTITSTAAVVRATVQRFVPTADPLSRLPPAAQANAQLTEAIIVTISDGVAALLAYLAARRAAAAAPPDMGSPVDAGAP